MPCEGKTLAEQEREQRERQLAALEAGIAGRTIQLTRAGNRVTIVGWGQRGGWCDECAIRRLRQSDDAMVRLAVARVAPVGVRLTFGNGH